MEAGPTMLQRGTGASRRSPIILYATVQMQLHPDMFHHRSLMRLLAWQSSWRHSRHCTADPDCTQNPEL